VALMRVLFAMWEGRTHLYPTVPLAWSFYAAGHDVRVACQPVLVSEVVKAGLPAVSMGGRFDVVAEVMRDPTQLKFTPDASFEEIIAEVRKSIGLLTGYNDAMADDLVAFARRWRPDLVIWDPIVFVGRLAARSVGAADARILWGPDLFTHRRQTFKDMAAMLPPDLTDNPLLGWLSKTYERFGLEVDEDNDLVGRWTIDPTPPRLRLPIKCDLLPMRYVPYNGQAVPPQWLLDAPERPRICVTPGTSSVRLMGADSLPVAETLEALGKIDAEVVVGITDEHPGLGDNHPPNVRIIQALSLHMLLPTCSAIVHHGGAGTTLTAAVHGLPQLIVPWVADQTTNAMQIEAAGAGICLGAEEADVDAIHTNIVRLMEDPSFANAAADLKEEIKRQPIPADVVRTLEERLG
jgi:glycosyltransferase (activator-dependent family)